ncbi:LOW QUALITY PROTEIN: hypothetical protein PHMEG_00027229 [Phytophthora megakarya]|uniref:Tyr recombinase domain-containing protein n=1 Tax=Phytophthora megakarya TaxID=4795 RepID=A0A225V921_9STRA|nr:LOW QUALITY PROTEIN: hypothetical protein PHMEG_00027229 [Phytophthora megakarya]
MVGTVTAIMEYAMSLVDDLLTELESYLCQWIWAIFMTMKARKMSAFVCALGHFEWLRIPFRLKNASTIYPRVLDNTLWGFPKDGWKHFAERMQEAETETINQRSNNSSRWKLTNSRTKSQQIRMLLKGVKLFDLPRQWKAPVSVALLETCAMDLNLHDPADQALWGILCLAFFLLLRRSEIVTTTSTSSCWFALNAADIAVIDALGCPTANPGAASAVCIRLSSSKTNQTGASVTRMLGRSGHPLLCPVLGALLLLKSQGSLPTTIPAAVYTDSTGVPQIVPAERVMKEIKNAARAIGEDPARYGIHSLRSGGATDMCRAGVDALTIQLHGRWASETFKIYTRLCHESVAHVAARMVGRRGESTALP